MLELFFVETSIPLALCFQCVCAGGNPLPVVVEVVGSLGMFLFLPIDDAAVGLDFSV